MKTCHKYLDDRLCDVGHKPDVSFGTTTTQFNVPIGYYYTSSYTFRVADNDVVSLGFTSCFLASDQFKTSLVRMSLTEYELLIFYVSATWFYSILFMVSL